MRLTILACLLLTGTAIPASAQTAAPGVAQRVDRLEKELRAVQRKVFPGGSGQLLEPEISAPAAAQQGGAPSSSPVADLTARVGSLEQEMARMTGQIEQNGFKLRQLEEQLARFRSDSDFRLNALEGNGTPPPTPGTPPVRTPPAAATPPAKPAAAATPPADPPATEQAAATGDPAEDAYLVGYRLWEQKKYAEATAALKDVVAKYPKHRRASYAQNLLGRTYLDSGQPARAAEALYANYQKMPRGERAPDSLYYLGQSLVTLKPPKNAEACKVYAELIDVYGEKINQALKDRVAKARTDAKCGS